MTWVFKWRYIDSRHWCYTPYDYQCQCSISQVNPYTGVEKITIGNGKGLTVKNIGQGHNGDFVPMNE
ncbi:hypothetical protein ACFX2J_045834 [Malus domestica]